MALSEVRRNQLAYRYLVKRLSEQTLKAFFGRADQVCEEVDIPFRDIERLKLALLNSIDRSMHDKSFDPPKEEFGHMAWDVVIVSSYHEGVRLTDTTKRKIGNEAKRLGINTDEAMEFFGLLYQEVHNKIFQ